MATEYLRRELNGNIQVVYFYYQFQDALKQSAEEVLACLLKQLLEPLENLPSCLESQYQAFANSSEPPASPDLTSLIEFFIQCSKHFDRVFAMVDAFDECSQVGRQPEKIISALQALSDSGVKMFITTQPHLLGDLISDSSITLQIRADETDIERYVRSNLPRRVSKELEDDIVSTICAESDGMYTVCNTITNCRFLLASLQLDEILRNVPSDMRVALKDLPRSPDSAYHKVLTRIEKKGNVTRTRAYRALSWVFHALRPLYPDELLRFINVEPNGKDSDHLVTDIADIIESCEGLLHQQRDIYDASTIRFAHSTVRDYVRVPMLEPPFLQRVDIALGCIRCLVSDSIHQQLDRDRETELLRKIEYVSNYWTVHTKGELETREDVQMEILRSLSERECMDESSPGATEFIRHWIMAFSDYYGPYNTSLSCRKWVGYFMWPCSRRTAGYKRR